MGEILKILFSSLETGSVYALAALGIILILRTSKMTNFAQGVMGMFNAFFATVFLTKFGMGTLMSTLMAMGTAFLTGVLVDIVIMRKAKKSSSLEKQIITFGLIMLFTGITPMLFGTLPLSFPKFIPSGAFELSVATLSYNGVLNIGLGLGIMGVLFYVLQKTKWGLAIKVTASDEETAKLMGVPTKSVTLVIWALATMLALLSALMLAPNITVNVSMMENVQLIALISCILGGFQTFYGPVVGAYLIALVKNMSLFYVSSTWGETIVYSLILIFIVFRPYGLFGKKTIKKV